MLAILSTAIDIALRHYDGAKQCIVLNKMRDLSLLKTLPEILSSPDECSFGMFHGMRVFSMLWIILFHCAVYPLPSTIHSSKVRLKMASTYTFQFILNAWISVDTFFFLSGFLMAHSMGKTVDKGLPINFFNKVFTRYWRLFPMAMVTVALLFLVHELGDGPLWSEMMGKELNNCRALWWATLIGVQNFFSAEHQCLQHLWYISAEFQLYAVLLLVTYLSQRWSRTGIGILAVGAAASVVSVGTLTYVKQYHPTALFYSTDLDFTREIINNVYIKPSTHAAPYIVGVWAGHVAYSKPSVRMSKTSRCICWLVSLTVMPLVLFTPAHWSEPRSMVTGVYVLYAATHRFLWALAIAWITLDCIWNPKGFISKVLSWPILVPFSRLSYVIYLCHVLVIYLRAWTIRIPLRNDIMGIVEMGFGTFALSTILALLLAVLFEKTLVQVRCLLGRLLGFLLCRT
ncbi:nose resistant to fluoxetine protein 6-like [Ornithodoros turicata]|uniref:nose resistant to fluoxetine protein 6-like n=1 Tax=Ornithodoros turicata TaxID=34597 RepID=UPI0031388324